MKKTTDLNGYQMPEAGFMRIWDVLRVIPVKKSYWESGVKNGRFPKPVKLGARIAMWKVEDIRKLIADLGAGVNK